MNHKTWIAYSGLFLGSLIAAMGSAILFIERFAVFASPHSNKLLGGMCLAYGIYRVWFSWHLLKKIKKD